MSSSFLVAAPDLRQLANPVLLDYLREIDRTAEVIASVCTGSLLLAGAGLLQGLPLTGHIVDSLTGWERMSQEQGRGWPLSDGCRRVRGHRHRAAPCQQVGER